VRPREAAIAARAVPGLRRSERAMLELLLRLSRGDAGELPWHISTATIAAELGYTTRAIKYARQRLVERRLIVVVKQGVGSTRTLYRVDRAAVVSSSLPGDHPVNRGENAESSPPEPGHSFPHSGETASPPRGNHFPTYTRARRSTPLSRTTPQPPASGGQAAGGQKCPKAAARGQPCHNCRACGTTARQVEQADRRNRQLAEAADRLAEQLAARQAAEDARADLQRDGPSPAYLAARAALTTQPTDRETRV
jgi:hypothetical protein